MTKHCTYQSVRLGGVLLVLCVCLFPSLSAAQNRSSEDALQGTIYRKPVDFVTPDIRVGGFQLSPGVELGWENSDNIFYIPRNVQQIGLEKIRDNILHVRPWLDLKSDWNRHELNLHAFVDAARYDDYDSQNYTDWLASLDGRIDVKSRSAFNYSAGHWRLHQNRSDPDDRNAIEPTKYTSNRYSAGYSHTFNRLTPELRYRYQDNSFDNNENLIGEVIDNKDRDRSRQSLALQLDYAYSDLSSIFLSYETNKVDYDLKFDSDGFQRSSDGYNLRSGLSWRTTGLLNGRLYAQYLSQDYDDPRFNNVDGFGIGAALSWTPTELTDVRFRFENTPRETRQTGSSGSFSQLYEVRVQHELRRNILLNGRYSYTDDNYETNKDAGSSLQDSRTTEAGFSVNYLFNRYFYISGGYIYEKQNANESFYDYATNRWFFALGMEL